MKTRRRFLKISAAATLGAGVAPLIAPNAARAAPSSELIDEHWLRFGSEPGPNHDAWTRFVSRHRTVDARGVARLDYAAAQWEFEDVADYVMRLEQQTPTRMTREAAFAYWANLYNSLTVLLILSDYPVETIREVRGGLFNSGPWGDKVTEIEGRGLSLDDIEHGVLRPIWADPRVHYAVNCASVGCPNLRAEAWNPATLDADLDAAARAFVNSDRGAVVEEGYLTVSSIYSWFMEDFGDDDASVIAHLARYAEPDLAAALQSVDDIYDDQYDWSLNDVMRGDGRS